MILNVFPTVGVSCTRVRVMVIERCNCQLHGEYFSVYHALVSFFVIIMWVKIYDGYHIVSHKSGKSLGIWKSNQKVREKYGNWGKTAMHMQVGEKSVINIMWVREKYSRFDENLFANSFIFVFRGNACTYKAKST